MKTGWIVEDFDWATWAHGAEGQLIANYRTALANANREHVATSLVLQDRFVEGALSDAYETGLLLAIAKRGSNRGACGMPVLQMLIAEKLRFIDLRGERMRYRSATIKSYRLEMNLDEDDMPADA